MYDTMKWLSDNIESYELKLYKRKTGDKRPDTEVKIEILNQLTKEYYIE